MYMYNDYVFPKYFNLGLDNLDWFGNPYLIIRNNHAYAVFVDPIDGHGIVIVKFNDRKIDWYTKEEVTFYRDEYRELEKFKLDRILEEDIALRRIEDILRYIGE